MGGAHIIASDRRLIDALAYIHRWVAYQQSVSDVPGLVVAIRCGRDLVLHEAYGHADLERDVAMTVDHVFRVASHSKMFTATAIMQLVERGSLRLDDPIGVFLPWLEPHREVAAVTLRQLLNHAGGISRDSSDAGFWQLTRPFPNLAELRRLLAEDVAILPANESFKYSNLGYSLLGLVIEAVSGMTYHQYVRQHIIVPLGLADTGPEIDANASARLVTGYTHGIPGFPRRALRDVETGAMAAATGFYSTAADLCRYSAAHCLGNQELLSDASKREMQQPYWAIAGTDEHYGLGFSVVTIGERRLVGHGGAFPGHSTRTMIDPLEGLAVVVLLNDTTGAARTLATGVVKILNFGLKQQESREWTVGEQYNGRFFDLWGVTDIARFCDALLMLHPDLDDPIGSASQLTVVDDQSLRITRGSGYGAPGETVRYQRDATGQAVGIVVGGTTSYVEDVYRERLRTGEAW